MVSDYDLALKMYEAYRNCAKGKTIDGSKIPEWDDLEEGCQINWISAARVAKVEISLSDRKEQDDGS